MFQRSSHNQDRPRQRKTMAESYNYNFGKERRNNNNERRPWDRPSSNSQINSSGSHNPSRSKRNSSSSHNPSRSKVYERYDVNVKSSSRRSSRSSSGRGGIGRYSSNESSDDNAVLQRLQRRNRLLLYAAAIALALIVWRGWSSSQQTSSSSTTQNSAATSNTKIISNSYFSKKNTTQQKQQQHQKQQRVADIIETKPSSVRKRRWNPCLNTKYELERHDFEPRHGDLCRAKGGLMGLYECPEGCHETAGNPPYCANDGKGQACRVRDPSAPPQYRCDMGSICIMAVGTPKEQFKGSGQYYDDTCNNKCGDGRKGDSTSWMVHGGRCTTNMDCSLSGVCMEDGKCQCDLWAEGVDCSYLKFAPVDKSRLGYLHEDHSSWGGSIVQKSGSGEYQMYVSEILCKEDKKKRCGLNNWETHSRIALATSSTVDGPYQRVREVLHPEHHNPSVHISPTTGDWHLFTISGPTGPIERMISKDEGMTWGNPITMSPRQNPGPLMKADGSTHLFYRADGMDLPSPTCSNEGISVQHCPSDNAPCNTPNDVPVFGHTGEDPSVFVDHRGYYHMLFNALPYKCVPKVQQGGHAWSIDGINWSTPRIGAFDTTIQFTDGSSMKCERRERPQMVINKDGRPLALSSAVTGCPKSLGDNNIDGDGQFYRGGDDSFTVIQKMGKSTG